MSSRRIQLLIVDVDNTLFDWVRYFVSGYRAARSLIVAHAPFNENEVDSAFREVYRSKGAVEYGHAVQELSILRGRHELAQKAQAAQRAAAAGALQAYPGVASTLRHLRLSGVQIVALTNSPHGLAARRLKSLQILHHLAGIGAKDRKITFKDPWRDPTLQYEGGIQDRKLFDVGKTKHGALAEILDHYSVDAESAWMVGDSWERDLLPAIDLGIQVLWAEYGARVEEGLYEELLKVTPWTVPADYREPDAPEHIARIESFSEVAMLASLQLLPIDG